jgi:thermitase
MKRMIFLFMVAFFVISLASVNSEENNENERYVPGELIIKFRESPELSSMSLDLKNCNAKSSEIELEKEKIYFSNDSDMEKIADYYSSLPNVEYAEPNYILHTFEVPNDPSYNLQWAIPNILADYEWNISKGNSSIIIAVLDTGVEYTHEDFGSCVYEDLITDSCEKFVGAYDFVNVLDPDCTDADCTAADSDPMDNQGHGTHVAGIAGATTNNSKGIAGICPNCKIMPVRVGYKCPTGSGGCLTIDNIEDGLIYAADNNADIISMSFGGPSNFSSLYEAINYAYSKGVILVAAAGNDGANIINYPAGYSNVISVAATTSLGNPAGYSNFGSWVDVAAPGSSIYSTMMGNSYEYLNGTSMATPVVSGVIGLIASATGNRNKIEVLESIENTGDLIDFSGFLIPKINAYSATLFLDRVSPNVTLDFPENNELNASTNKSFRCNFTDWQLKNVSLKIWNSTGEYYNSIKNSTGTSNQSSFDVHGFDYGNYEWNCLVYDEQGILRFLLRIIVLLLVE